METIFQYFGLFIGLLITLIVVGMDDAGVVLVRVPVSRVLDGTGVAISCSVTQMCVTQAVAIAETMRSHSTVAIA